VEARTATVFVDKTGGVPHSFSPWSWRRNAPLVVAVLALVVLASCGEGDAGDTAAAPMPLPDHPGAEPYAQHCASCHGADLRGTDEGPSHLSVVYEPGHHPDWSFEVAVREGVRAHHWSYGDMPPIPDIDDDELDDLIAYIRAVQEDQGFEPYPPPG
jgi:mono/diheme cytochrome c family protein